MGIFNKRRRDMGLGRSAKNARRAGAQLDPWLAVSLNCPFCGKHLAARVSHDTYVYACTDHGDFFIAAQDGRLHDVARALR